MEAYTIVDKDTCIACGAAASDVFDDDIYEEVGYNFD
jgi:ferredoxin